MRYCSEVPFGRMDDLQEGHFSQSSTQIKELYFEVELTKDIDLQEIGGEGVYRLNCISKGRREL